MAMAQQHFFMSVFFEEPFTELMQSWKKERPSLGVLALVAEASKHAVPDIQRLSKETGVPIVGAIFPEIIHDAAFEKEGVLFVRMDHMPEYLLEEVTTQQDEITQLSRRIARHVEKLDHPSLFMIFDAMVPNIASVLDELYLTMADSAEYSGVNAGSETFQPMPCLFDSEQLIQGGMLALILPAAERAFLSHGYPIPEDMSMATSTKGNCIHTIDWQPAFAVHQQLAREWYDTEINADNFYQIAVHFPFGIVLANGEVLVRIPVAISEDGGLYCVGEVPENAMLTVLHADDDALLESVRKFGDECGKESASGLTFYCAGRRMHLQLAKATEELKVLKGEGREICGALSLGEIGMSKISSYPQFHNAALVYTPWFNSET